MTPQTPTVADPQMRSSLDDYLRVAAPHIPPALVSSDELSRIRSVAQGLPPASMILESRLDCAEPQADFLPRFAFRDGSAQSLRHDIDHVWPVAPPGVGRPWDTVRGVCLDWTEPHSAFADPIKSLWFEFDLIGNDDMMPVPCLFLDLATGHEPDAGLIEWVVGAGGQRSSDGVSACLASLPEGGRLFSFGVMLGRSESATRLCLSGIEPRDVLQYLEEIGWAGPTERAATLLDLVSPHADRIGLALDVGEAVLPNLGLEGYVDGRVRQTAARWSRALDHLTRHKVCAEAKRDATLAWPGYQNERQRDWPENLRALSRQASDSVVSVFVRRISHIKGVVRPDGRMQLKAYLEFMHHWLQPGSGEGRFKLDERFPVHG